MLIESLLHTYGPLILFGVLMFESMGVPLPGETALVASAVYAASTRQVSIEAVIAAAALGAIVGDNIGYGIGRHLGLPLLRRYGPYLHLDASRLELGQYLFRQHGGKIVFFGRFIAFLRTFAALLAGANHMRWPHFLLMNALGGICWTLVYGLGAFFLGRKMELISGPIGLALFAVALVAIIAGTIFFRRHEAQWLARIRAEQQRERDTQG